MLNFKSFIIKQRVSIIDDLEKIVALGKTNKYFPSQSSRRYLVNFLNLQPFRVNKTIKTPIHNNFIDKNISFIFLICYIIFPVFITLLLYFFRNSYGLRYMEDQTNGDHWLTIFDILVYPVFIVFITIFLWFFSWNFRDKLKLSGLFFVGWAISFWLFLPFISSFIVSLVYGNTIPKTDDVTIQTKMISTFVEAIFYFILIIIYFTKFYIWRSSFIFQFVNNLTSIIIWVVGGLLAVTLLNYIFSLMGNLNFIQYGSNIFSFSIKSSSNQNNLVKIFQYSWVGKVLIFFSSVITAPLIEECACREGLFRVAKTKNNGFFVLICSILFFSNMHVMGGDSLENVSQIVNYLGISIVLSTIFFIKQNVSYTVPIHLLSNLMVFISLCLR